MGSVFNCRREQGKEWSHRGTEGRAQGCCQASGSDGTGPRSVLRVPKYLQGQGLLEHLMRAMDLLFRQDVPRLLHAHKISANPCEWPGAPGKDPCSTFSQSPAPPKLMAMCLLRQEFLLIEEKRNQGSPVKAFPTIFAP